MYSILKKSPPTSYKIIWPTASKRRRDTFLLQALYTRFSSVISEQDAANNWLFIIKNITREFTHSAVSLDVSIVYFQRLFHQKIRELQFSIPTIGHKIDNFHNFVFLQNISTTLFTTGLCKIGLFYTYIENVLFNTKLASAFNNQLTELNIILKLSLTFGINVNIPSSSASLFNFYLFLFYLKLYELEEILQWLNWVAFRIYLQQSPYKFYRSKTLAVFLTDINKFGYRFWYEKKFHSINTVGFKLKKKWRFWRGLRRCLLFDKLNVFTKFGWLFNHKRLLNHQCLDISAAGIMPKLRLVYKKKTSKPKLFHYLLSLEHRIDILSIHVFKIKSVNCVYALLYFGYLTVNLKKTNPNYLIESGDIIFGWLLLKTPSFFRKLITRLHRPYQVSASLEYEAMIRSLICLTPPVYYTYASSAKSYDKDRVISKKFIKYLYLKTF